MSAVWLLTTRVIKIYIRDRAAVFFSFLSMFIIVGLYALFLGDMNANSVKSMLKSDAVDARFLIDSWMMAGIIVVNSVTISLGVFGMMVEDITKKRIQGIMIAPISRAKIVMGYLTASWIVTYVLCLISVVLAEAYIISTGGELLPAAALLKVAGLTLLSVFTSSSLIFFLVSFVKSNGAFSTMSTIIGTLIGFVTGIYIPIGALPEAAQSFIKFVPMSYLTAYMREIFVKVPMDQVFKGAPEGAADHFSEVFGITLKWGDTVVQPATVIIISLLSGLLFLGLSILLMRRKKKA